MPGLIIWKNREIDRMRRDIDRLFDRLWDDFCSPTPPGRIREVPLLEITETRNDLILNAEIQGVNPKDLDISITDDKLSIKGVIKDDTTVEEEADHRTKQAFGSFSRTLQLPCKVAIDHVKAGFKNGILTVVMPKCKSEARKIQVKSK